MGNFFLGVVYAWFDYTTLTVAFLSFDIRAAYHAIQIDNTTPQADGSVGFQQYFGFRLGDEVGPASGRWWRLLGASVRSKCSRYPP